jgi:hypothetical protein
MRVALAMLGCALAAWPQGPPSYTVQRAAGKIVVDGKLDEAAWREAPPVELLFAWEAQTGAKQKTRVKLLWDAEYLYAGFACEDADIVAHFDKRDDPTYRDDAVEIFLNPNPKQNFYYGLEMNAQAVLYDYFYAWPHLLIKRVDFSGVQLATHIVGTLNVTGDKDEGWQLELAIPWRNFEELGAGRGPKAGDEWTANLNRWYGVEPARRLSVWADTKMARPTPHQPERFGRLKFTE